MSSSTHTPADHARPGRHQRLRETARRHLSAPLWQCVKSPNEALNICRLLESHRSSCWYRRTRVWAAPESRVSQTQIHFMSEWSSYITAQECTVQLRRLVKMRFLCQPIIPPRMVAMGFLSCRSESLVLCGRTEAANVITVAFGEKSGPLLACDPRLLPVGNVIETHDQCSSRRLWEK